MPVMRYADTMLPAAPDAIAPDGSEVRLLLGTARGDMVHFTLAAGECAHAVRHRSVDEIWYVTSGQGEMWRRDEHGERVVELVAGTCITIPVGTQFQFRAARGGDGEPLCIVAVTMPPWPGVEEAVIVDGVWSPTVHRGDGA